MKIIRKYLHGILKLVGILPVALITSGSRTSIMKGGAVLLARSSFKSWYLYNRIIGGSVPSDQYKIRLVVFDPASVARKKRRTDMCIENICTNYS